MNPTTIREAAESLAAYCSDQSWYQSVGTGDKPLYLYVTDRKAAESHLNGYHEWKGWQVQIVETERPVPRGYIGPKEWD